MRWLYSIAIPLACARVASAEPDLTECVASIHGHVVDSSTHEAVPGATVRVGQQVLAETDASGRFAVTGICAGPTSLVVERGDYAPNERMLAIAGAISLEIALTPLPSETIEVKDAAPDRPLQSTTTVKGAALDRNRGKGFSKALAEVAGTAQLSSATGMAKPIIRGQFGRRLLLYVDGVRHRAQEWGLDHAPEIDPFIADAIRVVRGVGGVRYGPDAIGGVVLVDPAPLRREPGTSGEAHLIGASNGRGGTLAGRVQTTLERLPSVALQLEGSAKRLAAAESPSYALDNTGVLEWSAGVRIAIRRKRAEHELSYRRYQAGLGVCSCLRIENADEFFAQIERGEPINADLFRSDFEIERPKQTVAHDLALARSRFELEGIGSLTATYAFQYDLRREFDIVRGDVTGAQFNFRLMTNELAVELAHNPFHLDEHWHLRGVFGLVGMAQTHRYTGLDLVPDHTSAGAAAYALERLIGHAWEFEAGVRYDFTDRRASIDRIDFLRLVRSDQIAMDACGDPDADPIRCNSRYHTLTASLGALHRFSETLTGKLELSTASRPPNPDEQYLNGTAPTFPVLGLGKPDLEPETTYSSSATATYQNRCFAIEASAYANVIRDYVYFAPAIDAAGNPIFDVLIRGVFPRFTTRAVDALFYGADGGFTWQLHPFELSGQVSLVRAKNTRDDSYLVFVPADRARGSVTYRAPERWGLTKTFVSLAGTYVTKQRRFDLAADFAVPPPAYFVLDAEVGTETRVRDQTVKVALQGANLTNARYRDYTSLLRYFADEPGWQVWLRLSVLFDSKGQNK